MLNIVAEHTPPTPEPAERGPIGGVVPEAVFLDIGRVVFCLTKLGFSGTVVATEAANPEEEPKEQDLAFSMMVYFLWLRHCPRIPLATSEPTTAVLSLLEELVGSFSLTWGEPAGPPNSAKKW